MEAADLALIHYPMPMARSSGAVEGHNRLGGGLFRPQLKKGMSAI
jgi:hypothetical protein